MNKEKSNFILGVAVGVAAVSLIGFVLMFIMYFQKDLASLKNGGGKNELANNSAPTPTPAPTPQPAPTPAPIAQKNIDVQITDKDHIRGNKDAKITIVEFSDIQCPYCASLHKVLKQVIEAYPNDVRWVYKHFPLDRIHTYSRKAAEATECAGEQGKFWEYLDNLFENQRNINNEYLPTAAGNVGLNVSEFESCLNSGKYASKVNDDYSLGQKTGVTGTPASVINGELIKGALPLESFKEKIESLK